MDETKLINITIDDVDIQVEPETTILEAAKKLNIEIPTFCHHDALSPYGACRLCCVEVIMGNRKEVKASCLLHAIEGMVIRTDSERIKNGRRIMAELLLARNPEAEELKEIARDLNVGSPRIKNKNEKCVLCGLCIRMCHERMGIGALGFMNRGIERKVNTPFEDYSDICQTCGACASVCPTGAIDLDKITKNTVLPIRSKFNMGLGQRPVIYVPFPQAVPKIPVIDVDNCVHMLSGNCGICSKVCEPKAIDYDQKEETLDLDVGAIVVATGFDLYDPSEKTEYGYANHRNVITGIEFERLVSASGPTEGHIEIDGKEPKRVALIQCVGSRETEEGKHEYCSRICCMYTAKHAHLVHDKIPDSEITIYYTDVRAFGEGYEEFYVKVKNEGVDYRRRELVDPIEVVEKGDGTDALIVRAKGHPDLEVDLVVLATAVEPRGDATEVMQKLNITPSGDGFMAEAHPKLKPLDTFTDGIFLSGCCQGPKDLPDTVAQASGAAARVVNILSKTELETDPLISYVTESLCRGCGFCVEVCPYDALSLEMVNQFGHMVEVAKVNESLCKGCGSCTGACLSGAIQVRGFNDDQIHAAISILGGCK